MVRGKTGWKRGAEGWGHCPVQVRASGRPRTLLAVGAERSGWLQDKHRRPRGCGDIGAGGNRAVALEDGLTAPRALNTEFLRRPAPELRGVYPRGVTARVHTNTSTCVFPAA